MWAYFSFAGQVPDSMDPPEQCGNIKTGEKVPEAGMVVEPVPVLEVSDSVPSFTGLMDDLRLLETSLVGLPQELVFAARTAFRQDRQPRGFP